MRRNCNLELRLLPSSASDVEESQRRPSTALMANSSSASPQQSQPLTIFYNGKICVCDVSDFQAKAILLLANKEVNETVKTPTGTGTGTVPSSPSVRSPVYTPTAALSMKRSLQRFLEKRAHRAQAMATPYLR